MAFGTVARASDWQAEEWRRSGRHAGNAPAGQQLRAPDVLRAGPLRSLSHIELNAFALTKIFHLRTNDGGVMEEILLSSIPHDEAESLVRS